VSYTRCSNAVLNILSFSLRDCLKLTKSLVEIKYQQDFTA
jgi:hypothetical protein